MAKARKRRKSRTVVGLHCVIWRHQHRKIERLLADVRKEIGSPVSAGTLIRCFFALLVKSPRRRLLEGFTNAELRLPKHGDLPAHREYESAIETVLAESLRGPARAASRVRKRSKQRRKKARRRAR